MTRDVIDGWMARLERWVGLHPVAGSDGLERVADDITLTLGRCGFAVERHHHRSGDLLVARMRSEGPLLGLYGHYDVEPGGRKTLEHSNGRVYGRGVADNLGPLALRVSVCERMPLEKLNLLWVIEPGEEVGSPALGDWLALHGRPRVDLWLDETGYFDADGTQRMLMSDADQQAHEAERRCTELAIAAGRATRTEHRRLRRIVDQAGFRVETLFDGRPYMAVGPNDDASNVHSDDESLPLDTVDLSAHQFEAILDVFGKGARG